MPEFILLQCTRLDVRSVSVKYEFKMMYNGNCQSAVAAAAAEEAVMWGCVCVFQGCFTSSMEPGGWDAAG